jgi:nicotinamidase-related amidase
VSRKLRRDGTALVVVDVQEGFRKAVPSFERVAKAAATLVAGAEILEVPVVITEQYPKGLGETATEVSEYLPDGTAPIEKVVFSAAQADGFDLAGRGQAIVCGIESHVCVSQTAIDLLESGTEVHIPIDAVASRTEENMRVGLHKMEQAGAIVTSVEAALFELLGRAGTDEFKAIQRLILDHAPNKEPVA